MPLLQMTNPHARLGRLTPSDPTCVSPDCLTSSSATKTGGVLETTAPILPVGGFGKGGGQDLRPISLGPGALRGSSPIHATRMGRSVLTQYVGGRHSRRLSQLQLAFLPSRVHRWGVLAPRFLASSRTAELLFESTVHTAFVSIAKSPITTSSSPSSSYRICHRMNAI
ncbi:unnamed protein product [Periconia digitata]|uniref:Uncharacterized protein n=1 Tax=Periconia digitata TaxID=1303443 RepID=A0A9W4UK29_9PLEO|nr:unnamed protein product [Periconia digitata]